MSTTETYATRNDPVQIRTPDGCLLSVRRFGPQNGPPVLLLGGGEGAMRRWRGLLPALCVDDRERGAFAGAGSERSLGEHLRVVVFDPRGTGWSSRSHGVARTVKEAAADALAVAAALFDGPFHLVGHSLGGCVALEVALAGGKLVRSLALLSSTAGGEGRTPPDDEYLALRETAGDPLSQPEGERQADVLRRQVELTFSPAFAQAHPELLALLTHEAARELRWQRRLAARGADVAEAAEAHAARLASPDLAARLGGLAVPTLVVHGRQDRPVPSANGAYLAEHIPGARLELLEGGHDLTIERAAELIDLIHRHVLGTALR